jgi:hypothetical protein
MCQFASPKDQTYKALIRSIKRIQHGSEVEVKNEFYVVPHAASEHFTGRNEIRERLSGALLSCRTSKTQQRFVLYGLGGSGKTQICLKFAEDNRERSGAPLSTYKFKALLFVLFCQEYLPRKDLTLTY